MSDVLTPEKVILFTDDIARIIYLYRGKSSSLVLYLIGLRLAKEIRKAMRGLYQISELKNESQIESIKNQVINEEGNVLEIINPNLHLSEDGSYDIDFAKKLQLNQDPSWRERITEEKIHVFNKPNISKTLSKIKKLNPIDTFKTEMILVNNQVYFPQETLTSFFLNRKTDTEFQLLGNLPDGRFFKSGYSSRITVFGGSIQCIEFLSKKIENNDENSKKGTINASLLKIPRIIEDGSQDVLSDAFNIPEDEFIDVLIQRSKEFRSNNE